MYGIPTDDETLELLHWLSVIPATTGPYTQWYPLLYALGIRCMADVLLWQNLGPQETVVLRQLLDVPPLRMKRFQANIFLRAINALPPRGDA